MSNEPAPATNSNSRPTLVAAGCCIALAACVAGGLLPLGSLRLCIVEAWPALLIALAAMGLGGIAMICLGLGRAAPRWQIVLGTGLGSGLLSLTVLGLGVTGHLSRNLWFGIVAALAVPGVAFAIRAIITVQRTPPDSSQHANFVRWLWLLAMPSLALGLFAASFPPGILWPTEGNGYDVLEYHFGAPREYYDAGKIEFLPHNIYSNFPFNVEMLYLLTFILRGGPHQAAIAAQFLNVILAGWAVAAAWLAGRSISPTGGHVVGVLTATCPWLAWLCGVAYVENGLLMFSGLALAALLEAMRGEAFPARPARWMSAAGLAAGLACDCKYTAIPMVAAPLMIAAIALGIRRRSWLMPTAFAIAATVMFAPWAIKNAVNTDNPIFPLARSVFHERSDVWTEDGAARWHEGHLPDPAHRSVTGRLSAIRDEIVKNGRFGWVLYAAIAAVLMWPCKRLLNRASPTRKDATLFFLTCVWTCAAGVFVWLAATHLQDRFLVPILIPAAVLIAVASNELHARYENWVAMILVTALAIGGTVTTYRLFDEGFAFKFASAAVDDAGSFQPEHLSEALRAGEFPGSEHLPVLLDLTERGGRVLMVGDARAFYLNQSVDYHVVFNRNPLDSAARRFRARRVIEWLRTRGYSYIYVDWNEMNRLRKSRYGFWKSIDEQLFENLVNAGLQPIRNIPPSRSEGPPHATLFRIPEKLPDPDLKMF